MMISFSGGRIGGTVRVPASKSITHRAVFMSAMCQSESFIRNALMCQDTISSIEAVRALGASVEWDGCCRDTPENTRFDRETCQISTSCEYDPMSQHVTVQSGGCDTGTASRESVLRIRGGRMQGDAMIDAGNSGTTLRFAAGMASLSPFRTVLTGDESLSGRPMRPLLDSLSSIGAVCTSEDGHAPVSVRGPAGGGEVTVDGSISSQFVSSLLMAAPLMEDGLDLHITGNVASAPYIRMTVRMMRDRGIPVTETDDGYRVPNGSYLPAEVTVTGDWTSAAYILAAGALGGSVTVTGLDTGDMTGDAGILGILRTMGADVTVTESTVTCSRRGRLRSGRFDMSDTPDLFPVAAVLLSTAEGEGELYGAPNLRYKESDRIALTADMLNTLGADVECTDEGCIICGRNGLNGGTVDHSGDHRMMMAAALSSLCCASPVSTEDDGCWNVSFPGFPDAMSSIGMEVSCTR